MPNQHASRSVLEFLALSRGRKAATRLAIAGVVITAIAEVAVGFWGGGHQYILEAGYALWLVALPPASVIMQERWIQVHDRLAEVVRLPGPQADVWIASWHRTIFGPQPVKLTILGLFWAVGMVSIMSYDPPYADARANLTVLAVFGVVLFTAGLFAWMVVAYAASLLDLARRASTNQLFAAETSQFGACESFWLWVSVFTSFGYALIFAATTFSTYASQDAARPWLWIASSAPLIVVLVGFLLFHLIRSRLKYLQTDALLRALAQRWRLAPGRLEEAGPAQGGDGTLMDLLAQTRSSSRVPAMLASAYTFLIAMLPIAIQAYSALGPQGGTGTP